MAGGPHQRRELVAGARVDVDARIEQPPHDVVEAARGGIDHRGLAGGVAHIADRRLRQQRLDDAVVALEGGRDQRRQAGASGQIGIGALVQKKRDSRMFFALGGGEQSRPAVDIARVDRRAFGQEKAASRACPPRAAWASGIAPRRSRASTEPPAAMSFFASGSQPRSAAANNAILVCIATASALIMS